ncbi:MAG: carboxylating nicotinate-nucleotide diphosphorylase [Actinobacteria bacterium]|nr:carboxylating nicotinate-nucleotide diphosphorylase [Actinomycetota bacterium]
MIPADPVLRHIVTLSLEEDLDATGDITSRAIFGADHQGAARVITRQTCVISGMEAAAEVCLQIDPDLKWLPLVRDGQRVPADAEIGRLDGRLISILAAERTVLNFLSRLSGVATLTAAYVGSVQGTGSAIAATRKTSPGLRMLEKLAVTHGGGQTHRQGLYDAVLIKDNHIAAAGGVAAAISALRQELGAEAAIEVEVETAAGLEEAIASGAATVLLDNMAPETVRQCVELAAGRVVIEASGGIGLGNVRQYALAGADVISVGALTRSAEGIDFSLEMAD